MPDFPLIPATGVLTGGSAQASPNVGSSATNNNTAQSGFDPHPNYRWGGCW